MYDPEISPDLFDPFSPESSTIDDTMKIMVWSFHHIAPVRKMFFQLIIYTFVSNITGSS